MKIVFSHLNVLVFQRIVSGDANIFCSKTVCLLQLVLKKPNVKRKEKKTQSIIKAATLK